MRFFTLFHLEFSTFTSTSTSISSLMMFSHSMCVCLRESHVCYRYRYGAYTAKTYEHTQQIEQFAIVEALYYNLD